MSAELRRASRADEPAIRELVFSVLKEYGLQPDPETTDADLFNLDEYYFSRGGDFWVLFDQSAIIGTTGLHPISQADVELRKMYLATPARGRGLGRNLLQTSLERARELGFSRVTLETASVLKEASRLYESFGFVRLPETPTASRCDTAYELLLD